MSRLLEYFEKTVQRFPDKTAVACRDKRYTFAELKNMSQRLGQRIAERDSAACGQPEKSPAEVLSDTLQPEPAPIGVIVDRGVDTAVFFLAALYSGNFYVPIDPELPREKRTRIFADAGFRVILCGDKQRDALRELDFAGEILTVADAEYSEQKEDAKEAFAGAGERPDGRSDAGCMAASPDTPAYMIYTSGSTGQPKGVLKSHGAVIDFMETFIPLFDLGPEEIIGNQTPFFFDASAKDFYLMLFTGATLEVLPSELFVLPVTLIEYMNERHITYICWVPSALSVVTQLHTFSQVVPTDLTKIFFVGETFPVKHLQNWMEALPNAQYVNLYGSTEIAGVCCFHELPVPFEGEAIPIGRPLPNCQVLLLETSEEQVPSPGPDEDACQRVITGPDDTGELYVVSDALALEYFHDPARTAATFVTLTLPDGTRARALRTGDLAKYNAEGDLYFVSRNDDQIKHMGYRIEPGEIESAAYEIPEIARCYCLFQEEKDRLCLFCELVPGCDWDKKAVRRALQDRLSEYMLPSRYNILDELPLNANGKVDRARLKELL